MRSLGEITVPLARGLRAKLFGADRVLRIEVMADGSSTHVFIDCSSCRELLRRRLPRGELINIVSAIKDFFERRDMSRVEVRVAQDQMVRVYQGELEPTDLVTLRTAIEQSLTKK